MLKFLRIWFILVYIIPFAYVLEREFVVAFISIIIAIFAFYFSSFWNIAQDKTPINYSGFFTSSPRQLSVCFLCYLIFKYSYIMIVLGHLINGDLIEWSLENAIARYSGDAEDVSLFYQLGVISMFVYSMLLGSFGVADRKTLILGYLGLAFIFIIESSTLGRAGTLFCLVGLFSEVLIRKSSYFQKLRFKKLVKLFAMLIVIIACVFLYSAINRLDSSDDVGEILKVKVGEYVVAPYQAFYVWERNPDLQNTPSYPFFNLLTAIYKLNGVFVMQGSYSMVSTSYGETNIYTVFRALYADLGWFLTTIFMFCFGVVIKYVTYFKMNWMSYFVIRSILFIFIFTIYSPYYSSTFFIAAVLAPLILYFGKISWFNNLQQEVRLNKNFL